MFKALILEEADGQVASSIRQLEEPQLPEGDVTVAVEYSTLNYKDGMILNGLGRLVRRYPHVPGIDFSGVVEQSRHPRYRPGDRVILTGWRVGEIHWGGYAQKARIDGDWLVPLPDNLTLRRAMAFGTAGFTAMLATLALEERGLRPGQGKVLVTGASGGVGSVAVAVLAGRGYQVTASTGRSETGDYLRELGATDILDRRKLADPPERPLGMERWAGTVDAVGGATLAHLLTQMAYGSSVAAIGLAGGDRLETSLIPFLLRGVGLLGIDSVNCPFARRLEVWQQLVDTVPAEKLDAMTRDATLADLPRLGRAILDGQVRGRTVIDVNA